MKHGTPVFGGTKKANPKKKLQKNKYRLNVDEARLLPTRLVPTSNRKSTTCVLDLLTDAERRSSVRKKPKLTDYQRLYLISFLQQHQKTDGTLEIGCKKKARHIFHVSSKTIRRLWKRYINTADSRGLGGDHTRHFANSGRKRKHFITDDMLQQFLDIPDEMKQTIRDIASALNIDKSSLGRLVKKGAVKSTVVHVKPHLTQINKIKRVSFALEHIDSNGVFQNMYGHVHIDKKWSYMFKLKKRLYLHPLEKPLPQKCVNKRHQKKVMIMVGIVGLMV